MVATTLGYKGAQSTRFEILSSLGSGGFGSVHEARDKHSGERVALKELKRISAGAIARFKQEFRALAGLHHPNLVGLKELVEQDGRWYIAMELAGEADLLQYVRGKGRTSSSNDNELGYDEARLRSALAGMAQGLSALHAFGVLHRDLKPTNVCVTPEGRAVLLDFGLVTSADPSEQSTHEAGVGTVAYMAPEQALGQKLSPAADWYAFGVCLFEALTGRLPFSGDSGLAIILTKQRTEAPLASTFASVPRDLADLCASLLARDPEERPSEPAIFKALGITHRPSTPDLGVGSGRDYEKEVPFAGRESELELLERALARTHQGELRIVLVEGESGVGKSELVQEFLRGARMRHVSLLSLRGRCYENEQVSYKAFDGCIDELAKTLRRLPNAECHLLLPRRAALLGQLFPVLHTVPAVAAAPRDALSADPTARRLEAFDALAELLAKLAEDRPLVLVIDDLQWADAESFRLLEALVDRQQRPAILIVATVRARDELEPDVLAKVEEVRSWKETDIQVLAGLPLSQAEALAGRLLGPVADRRAVRALAEESRGHPLFLGELSRFAHSLEAAGLKAITLEAALKARIEQLEPSCRALLELVALAGRPSPSRVLAQALGVESVEAWAKPLLSAKLLRARRGHELGCFHDRFRHVAVSLIPETRLPMLHRQLASALSQCEGSDISEQARHWDLAGDGEQAIDAYERAIIRALEALAFARAEGLSTRALELSAETRDARHARLLVYQARALAAGGHNGEAAVAYREAAQLERGADRLRLKSYAANHLLLSAQIRPGLEAARQVLGELGVSLPLETGRALLRFAWERARHLLFGRLRRATNKGQATERVALEVISMLARSIALVHTPAYLALSAQHLRLTAGLGTIADRVHTYGVQGWLGTLRGSIADSATLFARSRALCEGLSDPKLRAQQALTEGSARMLGWDIQGAEARLSEAHDLLRAHCPDQVRDLTTARIQLGSAWFFLGEHARLAREMDMWIAEARERKDHLAIMLLVGCGYGFWRHLMRDAPDEAIRELDASLANIPSEPYSFAQFGYHVGVQYVMLTRGGAAALERLRAHQAENGRRFLSRTRFGKDVLHGQRVMATLAACVSSQGAERADLLASAKEDALVWARNDAAMISGFGYLFLAQIAAAQDDVERARVHLQEARRAAGPNSLVEGESLYLEGVLDGSANGQKKREHAIALRGQQGWQTPEKLFTVYCPLLPVLAPSKPDLTKQRLLLGRYELLGQLGRGGFGTVVAARDTHTGRRIALKELVTKNGSSLERFKREFRALQDVHHPNLVRLDALLEHEGRWFIVMELLEGQDLISYVREDGSCNRERLGRALAGVAQGLSALHAAGFVHRDVNAQNIYVTRDGRAVLLDFGLIARISDSADLGMIGTADYAAPEQLEGTRPQPAADVYALGTCLYRALTGQLPYRSSSAFSLLQLKRTSRPQPPAASLPELSLSLSMLARDPAARPGLSDVLGLFAPDERAATTRSSQRPAASETPLCGRSAELETLRSALDRACDHGLRLALVQGDSGLGKSALADAFAGRLSAERPELLVLRSRCYENEQLALKAFDGSVDQLAQVLRELPDTTCDSLLPKKAALLAQLFPVLASVLAIANASKKGLPSDPAARRLAALHCFVRLLERVSQHFPLLLIVDDLQWADGESFRMLSRLMDAPTALRSLIVCTARPSRELTADAERELGTLAAHARSEQIALSRLNESDALTLAAQLLPGAESLLLRSLVAESAGHPLFLRELAERAKRGTNERGGPTLEEALRARLAQLSVEARSLVSLAAIAGKPVRRQVLARALGLPELPRESVIDLLARGLLRRSGEDELSCSHDQIRRVALASMDADAQRRLTRALAEALEAERSPDSTERARLWEAAGEAEPAILAYEEAGDRGLEALAFGLSEQCYARALGLLCAPEDARRTRLLIQRGHALVRMGKSAEAARTFQDAAERSEGEMRTRLRIWAAQHLIQSAQVSDGLSAATRVLAELGLTLPASDEEALRPIALTRLQIALRGTRLKERREQLASQESLALEALHSLSSAVRAVSYLPGSALVMHYLKRALDSGQSHHTARALAYEGLWRSIKQPGKDHGPLFAQSLERAVASGDPVVEAEVELMRGLSCFPRCDFKQAPKHLAVAQELLQTRGQGHPWLLTSARMYLGHIWMYTGDFKSIGRFSGAWYSEAKEQQDPYAVAALSGFGMASIRHLLADDPDAALAELTHAMAPWPEEPFATNHWGAFAARMYALRYKGGGQILEVWNQNRPRIERAFLLKTPTFRAATALCRAMACLQAIDRRDAARHPLFAEAMERARSVAPQRTALAHALSDLLLSSLRALEGKQERAIEHARKARTQLSQLGYDGQADAALFVEGSVEGGENGRTKCAVVTARIKEHGFSQAEPALRMVVPGYDLLLAQR